MLSVHSNILQHTTLATRATPPTPATRATPPTPPSQATRATPPTQAAHQHEQPHQHKLLLIMTIKLQCYWIKLNSGLFLLLVDHSHLLLLKRVEYNAWSSERVNTCCSHWQPVEFLMSLDLLSKNFCLPETSAAALWIHHYPVVLTLTEKLQADSLRLDIRCHNFQRGHFTASGARILELQGLPSGAVRGAMLVATKSQHVTSKFKGLKSWNGLRLIGLDDLYKATHRHCPVLAEALSGAWLRLAHGEYSWTLDLKLCHLGIIFGEWPNFHGWRF